MAATGGVSVIVRARDEAENLARCLEAIRSQRGVGEVEVVYVDGGSRDGSTGVARAHGATSVDAPPGFGTALNLGAERCTHDVLVALSAHAFPRHPDWLARIHQTLNDSTVACASGDDYGPDGGPLAAAVRQDAKLARRRPEWGYSNGAGAFQAGLWRQRPFREDLPGCEDKEWALHWLGQGYVCVIDPQLAVDHDHTHDSLRAIYARAKRESEGYAAFLDKQHTYGPRELIHDWWSDLRWYDSATRARLSHRRAARLLGSYAGRRG
jgi:rhamnosyltransferase